MSRYNSRTSYGHDCSYRRRWDYYEISWVVDFYYHGSRLRFPRTFTRDTDEKGARKFCKKWDIEFDKVMQDAK